MTKKTETKKTTKQKSAKQIAAQEALQVTWLLKGRLKSIQIYYLKIGRLLSLVREKKMYETLGHPNIEDYAEKRLGLGKTSLYKYLSIYEWTTKNHPEWLVDKPQGFIPELSDVVGLITIENGLKQKNVSPQKRAKLEDLKQKALTGALKMNELEQVGKTPARKVDRLKAFTSELRKMRTTATKLVDIPAEVITHLDAAIALLKNDTALSHLRIDTDALWA